ncbi:MAG: hypothetical protein JW783_04175 [Bacteroidales bacterium]|nr:hypothetical protein [Bacteroidales bacterium]MBN2750155.1 hypothetical protein [Bacteroidales bacterium]
MKKLILAIMAIVLMGTSYAQTSKKLDFKDIESTEIKGDIVLLYNGDLDPTFFDVHFKLYVGGYLFIDIPVSADSQGRISVSEIKSGMLPFASRSFVAIVTVNGYSRFTTGQLQHIPCYDYQDNYTFGLILGSTH